ncbi:hypothetical protein [Methanohalophilus portucalensis]|uniref:DUF4298 domain-containing protein n=2 Tax=Methanohalophilus portucalensis TaxID=39664 RepID=A0A1X7P133_9EURY|nr:hypothetical protein [Methanohalophilus portucalensis]ATU08084.1 hypothetical protein BKM01_04405 [Methanohalophilus portucalensis]RNI10061.1 hypothetical protein EFE41_08365 [Methanohalophilus portucalensis FDF-1]SMH44452.1 hypothetical protein SAMN06264941_2075 [Methanohalophilus portucalensis FDF-1]
MEVSISDDALPVVKESLEKEILLLRAKIRLAEKEIAVFEDRYNMPSSRFYIEFENGDLGDSQDFFEWWGLLRGLETLKTQLDQAQSVISNW